MEKDKVPIWYLLIPDQFIWIGVALILSPPIYSFYIFKYHKVGLAIMIFIIWLPLYTLFLKYLHRQGSASLPYTIGFTVFILTLALSAIYL